MYAVIETGGKQYRVTAGDKLRLEDPRRRGRGSSFDKVILLGKDDGPVIGTPM